MELIEIPPTGPAIGIEHGRIWLAWHHLVREVWHWRLKRWIPRLVWLDDEIDVRVTFKGWGALGGPSGAVWEAGQCFHSMGINFDAGSGCEGRDWEWDYSLAGPISVKFKGRAKRPERRVWQEPQKPKITVIK